MALDITWGLAPDWQDWVVLSAGLAFRRLPSVLNPSGFPPAESLDSLRSPFGPACGCYSASLRCSCLAKKKEPKRRPPRHPAPATPGFPPSGAAPGARHEEESLPLRSSLGVHASRPLRNTSTRPPDGDMSPSRLEDREFAFFGPTHEPS